MVLFARYKLVYKLRISDGGVHVAQGKAPAAFLAGVRDIVALHTIERGDIECKGRGRYARLRFSDDFPAKGRQAIRNIWHPPTTPGPGGGFRARG